MTIAEFCQPGTPISAQLLDRASDRRRSPAIGDCQHGRLRALLDRLLGDRDPRQPPLLLGERMVRP